MNLILLEADDFTAPELVVLRGRRYDHIRHVHQAQPGDTLRVGLLDGLLGNGTVRHWGAETLEMEIELKDPPPPPLQLTLVLALPRPKMLKRILQTVSSLGVKNIYLINSYKVDKSFWASPVLQPRQLQEQLCLGLEQAVDTHLPLVYQRTRFKPFVEDELPALIQGSTAYLAHPRAEQECPREGKGAVTLAIGPEGGFIPYEVEKLSACGFIPVTLGERILRVETAVPVLLARLT